MCLRRRLAMAARAHQYLVGLASTARARACIRLGAARSHPGRGSGRGRGKVVAAFARCCQLAIVCCSWVHMCVWREQAWVLPPPLSREEAGGGFAVRRRPGGRPRATKLCRPRCKAVVCVVATAAHDIRRCWERARVFRASSMLLSARLRILA